MLQWVPLALRPHFHLGWNLFLALVPLILALWLFRPTAKRNWLWWPVLAVFLVFLPNAAYTLSDIIHFVAEVRDDNPELPTWSVIYILIPKYAIFIFIGFQAHVISLIRVGYYLRWLGHRNWVHPIELLLNFLCAVGVYWGRWERFNSWEVVTMPQKISQQILSDLTDKFSLAMIGWYFCVITVFYFAFRTVDIAVWEYWRRRRVQGGFASPAAA